jgi:hypothetical protein
MANRSEILWVEMVGKKCQNQPQIFLFYVVPGISEWTIPPPKANNKATRRSRGEEIKTGWGEERAL